MSHPENYSTRRYADGITVEFTVAGVPCLGLNGGPAFKHDEAFSFQMPLTISLAQLGLSLPPGVAADDALEGRLEEEAIRLGGQLLAPTQLSS